MRNTQVTVYSETWRWYAISSLAAAAHSSPYRVIPAAPTVIQQEQPSERHRRHDDVRPVVARDDHVARN